MKKVLILAYDFPPYVSVGGLRPYSWYKYFKEFGLHPIVVTRQWGNKYGNHLDYIAPGESDETIIEETEFGTIIRTPYKPNLSNKLLLKYGGNRFKLIRKSITAYYEFMQFLFFIGPKSGLYYGTKEYLKNNKVDCIIATGEPFVLFKYAAKLSKENHIPWFADYRDPWTQSPLRSPNFLIKNWNKFFEKKLLVKVSAISTVYEFVASQIKTLLPDKSYHIIANGYNPESARIAQSVKQTNELFEIAFAGTMYNWHPINSFLSCMTDFISQPHVKNVKISFYGINTAENINRLIKTKYPLLETYVEMYPKLSNCDLLIELASKNILLLFNDYTIVGTKIFDYLALKRYILFCFSNDKEANYVKKENSLVKAISELSNTPQADIINKTNSGIIVKDEEHLKQALNTLFNKFRNTGKVDCNSHGIEEYSRKKQTEKLASLIKKLFSYEVPCNL